MSQLASLLAKNGFIAAEEEAEELTAAARDENELRQFVERRLNGEPLAWITGRVQFCGTDVRVYSGVYVPRWHSALLVERVAHLLPPDGRVLDVCTGTGALAKALQNLRPDASILATDIDVRAVQNAKANGIDAREADVFPEMQPVDLIMGVVPYVPTGEMQYLQRDTLAFESPRSYDGGDDGLSIVRRVLSEAPRYLNPGGRVALEIGADQLERLDLSGFVDVESVVDDDHDLRGFIATCR